MKRLVNHVVAHPYRLLATEAVLIAISLLLSIIAIAQSISANRRSTEIICLQMNEFRSQAYAIAIDLGAPLHIASRLLNLTDCENLP